jgi:cellobiose phosphorylase
MINPVNHTDSPETVSTYMAEPYVMAADVYSVQPHAGRAGWTWYTGSAAWMYRLIVESLLGISLQVDRLRLEPCLPANWNGFTISYRYRETVYQIAVKHSQPDDTGISVLLDGIRQDGNTIPLLDDHAEHKVEVQLGRTPDTERNRGKNVEHEYDGDDGIS